MTNFKALVKTVYRQVASDVARQRVARLRSKVKRSARGIVGSFNARCHVCRGKNVSRYKNPAADHLAFALFICHDCEFIFVHPTPDLSNVYSYTELPDFGLSAQAWNDQFLSALNKYVDLKGNLLEIGFGDASFLKLAHHNGWKVHGVDLSKVFVKHATEELKLPNIRYGTVEDAGYQDDFFDVIAAFNYIEHLPDPTATLQHLRRILRPGGTLVLLCPNLSGIYHHVTPEIFGGKDPFDISWVPPMHLSYFNKVNFRMLLESGGFEVVGDESHLTTSLWLQHQVAFRPEATNEKLDGLLAEIAAAKKLSGQVVPDDYRKRITTLLRERMLWVMTSDLMRLESALEAENAVLYIARKPGAAKRGPSPKDKSE